MDVQPNFEKMKTLKVTLLIMLGIVVAACNDDEPSSTNKLSSEEQAEMVAASMGKSGFAGSSDQSVDYADDAVSNSSGRVAACGYTAENAGSLSGTFGSVEFNYSYDFDLGLVCNSNEVPEKFTSNFTYDGDFDGPRFASDYSGAGSLTITQLAETDATYKINGSYDRAGSFESKIEARSSGSGNIEININDVEVNKTTKVITSGTADASVQGVVTGKGNYSFDARIVFNGNGTADITVSGDVYVMDLATGEVSAKAE